MNTPAMEIALTAGTAHQTQYRTKPFFANVVIKTNGGILKGGETRVDVHRFPTEQARDAFIKEYPR